MVLLCWYLLCANGPPVKRTGSWKHLAPVPSGYSSAERARTCSMLSMYHRRSGLYRWMSWQTLAVRSGLNSRSHTRK